MRLYSDGTLTIDIYKYQTMELVEERLEKVFVNFAKKNNLKKIHRINISKVIYYENYRAMCYHNIKGVNSHQSTEIKINNKGIIVYYDRQF